MSQQIQKTTGNGKGRFFSFVDFEVCAEIDCYPKKWGRDLKMSKNFMQN